MNLLPTTCGKWNIICIVPALSGGTVVAVPRPSESVLQKENEIFKYISSTANIQALVFCVKIKKKHNTVTCNINVHIDSAICSVSKIVMKTKKEFQAERKACLSNAQPFSSTYLLAWWSFLCFCEKLRTCDLSIESKCVTFVWCKLFSAILTYIYA